MENHIEITPQLVNNHISKMKSGGEIPADVQADLDMLKNNLENAANELQRTSIQKAINTIENQYINIPAEINFDEHSLEESNVGFENQIDLLTSGKFYKNFPDKLIGTVKLDTDRYNKDIRVVVGDISELSKIVVDDNFDQFVKENQIGTSSISPTLQEKLLQPDNVEFVKDIIEKSKLSIGNKAVARNKEKEKIADETLPSSMDNIQTARQIFHKLNPNISKSEIQAYIWYKDSIGQRLSDTWYELAEYESKSETIQD